MKRFLAGRLLSLFPTLLGISLIAFILGVISPGDPAEIALSKSGAYTPTPEQVASMRESMGLNRPLPMQYIFWLKGVVKGDFGTSYFTGRAVGDELARRLPVTIKLASYAACFACVFGLLFGIIGASFRDKFPDRLSRGLINIFLSFPSFWLALILILAFAEFLGWLPTSGMGGFRYMLAPAITLSSAAAAGLARLIRSSLLAELGKQYFLAASARGFGRIALLFRTALPNAALPAIAMIGNYLGGILGGSVIVETLFALPGIGSYAIEAISARDYPALQGYVLITGFCFVTITCAIDVVCALCNPKIRLGGASA